MNQIKKEKFPYLLVVGIVFIFLSFISLFFQGPNKPPNLNGTYESIADTPVQLEILDDKQVAVTVTLDQGEALYWLGSYTPPTENNNSYTWESTIDSSIDLDDFIIFANSKMQTFTYNKEDDEIVFTARFSGSETESRVECFKSSDNSEPLPALTSFINNKESDYGKLYLKQQEEKQKLEEKKQQLDQQNQINPNTDSTETEQKFSFYAAEQKVKEYGQKMYPYGFTLHYILGVKQEELLSPTEGYVKIRCDITNMYNATKSDLICEATISGSGSNSDNYTVTSFYVN